MRKTGLVVLLIMFCAVSCENSGNKTSRATKSKITRNDPFARFVHRQRGTITAGDTLIIYNGYKNGIKSTIKQDSCLVIVENKNWLHDWDMGGKPNWEFWNCRPVDKSVPFGFQLFVSYHNAKIGYDFRQSWLYFIPKEKYAPTFCFGSSALPACSDSLNEFVRI